MSDLERMHSFKEISDAVADGAFSKGKGKNPHAGIPGREHLAEAWDRGRAGWLKARAKMSTPNQKAKILKGE